MCRACVLETKMDDQIWELIHQVSQTVSIGSGGSIVQQIWRKEEKEPVVNQQPAITVSWCVVTSLSRMPV